MPTYFRWIATGPDLDAAQGGRMQYGSSDKAFWVFEMGASYRPASGLVSGRVLVVFTIDATSQGYIDSATHISSESDTFAGEAGHPDGVITKENEPGALGLGKKLYQRINNRHTTTARLATTKEFGKALGLSEKEVTDKPKGQSVSRYNGVQKWS